ncbi:MAG: UbiA family prenyltransferase [Methanomassiliicoccales archaeon]|nr:UbiA family prenyltransferase [Methanomassiliicoccales archaeon]
MNRFIQLFRIGNCIMGVVGVILAALVGAGTSIVDYTMEILVASAVVFTFIAAGNSLNDYMDREVDKKAHPERPIPSGKISPSTVLRVSAVLFSISLLLSLLLDPISIGIVVVAVLFMISYELKFKKEGFSGNFLIALLTGFLFFFGGAVVRHIEQTLALAAMAFLATLGREIIKDVEDMEADFDRMTLPKRIGKRKAGATATSFILVAVILSFEPYIVGFFHIEYLLIVLVADAIFIYSSYLQFQNPKRGQRLIKIGMFVALIAFLVGGLL